MPDATSPEQRGALTAHFRDDYANLLEKADGLQKRWRGDFAADMPLETVYFVGCAHHLTALMIVGHDKQLLREVLGSLDAYERKIVSHVLKSIQWPWLGRGIAKRMARVRRQQYLEGLSNHESFVYASELVGPFAQRIFVNSNFDGRLELFREFHDLVENYVIELSAFYEDLFTAQ